MTNLYISQTDTEAPADGVLMPTFPADHSEYKYIYFKRGETHLVNIKAKPGKTYTAYGVGDAPVLMAANTDIHVIEAIKASFSTYEDIVLSGSNKRLFYAFGGHGYTFRNVGGVDSDFSDQFLYFKACQNIMIEGCYNKNTNGDCVYFTASSNVTVQNCNFELPNGGAADAIQGSNEGKYSPNRNVKILNNTVYKGRYPNNYKGAIVLDGADDFEVSGNDVEGVFFGIGVQGRNGIVSNNIIRDVLLDTHRNSYGIGVSGLDCQNVQVDGNEVSGANRGILVAWDGKTKWPVMDTIDITNNTIDNCKNGIVIEVPMKGTRSGNTFTNIEEENTVLKNQRPVIFSIVYDGAGRSYETAIADQKELTFYALEFMNKHVAGDAVIKKV